jgi:hypothetical protein
VEKDVCVVLVEVSVGLGRKVASVVCVVVLTVVGGGGPLAKVESKRLSVLLWLRW